MLLRVELGLGSFIVTGLEAPFPAGAEPIDGMLVLLLRRSQEVRRWPVIDAGTRRPALGVPPSCRLAGGGQNPAPVRMTGKIPRQGSNYRVR
jgi:hypothetical protein